MLTGPGIVTILAIAVLVGAAGAWWRLDRLRHTLAAGAAAWPLDTARPPQHAASGLPTREPLLAAIAAANTGRLAIVEFADFDRLAAFDPSLAERVTMRLGERLARMAGRRFVAHVDRHQFAIWFAGDEAEAAAELLAAIGYALSDRQHDDEFDLSPEIRTALLDHAGDTSAEITLARAMALTADLTAAPAAPAAARDAFALEQDLRRAIDRGEFDLHFQPLIDAAEARVVGAEALLRWQHPTRGAIGPATFVPIVEAAGLIDEVGLWALNAACREAARWQRSGLGALRVAVNVSNRQIAGSDMQLMIARTLARHALPSSALEIELTESAATDDLTRTRALFTALRARGIRVAIDDFGTGFSSLTALRTLAFDKLKIDREFVTEVDRRRDSQAICQSIIALGRGLGIAVLAEGVERREEYAWLRHHGCRLFQGYHFARPLTADAFVRFAADRRLLAPLVALGPHIIQQQVAQRISQ